MRMVNVVPAPTLGRNGDAPPVTFNDRLHRCEAEAESLLPPGVGAPVEGIVDPGEVLRRDPDARVRDGEKQLACLHPRIHGDLPHLFRVADRVPDEVFQRAREKAGVHADGCFVGELDGPGEISLEDEGIFRESPGKVRKKGPGRHLVVGHPPLPGFHPHELDQLADHAFE